MNDTLPFVEILSTHHHTPNKHREELARAVNDYLMKLRRYGATDIVRELQQESFQNTRVVVTYRRRHPLYARRFR